MVLDSCFTKYLSELCVLCGKSFLGNDDAFEAGALAHGGQGVAVALCGEGHLFVLRSCALFYRPASARARARPLKPPKTHAHRPTTKCPRKQD